MLPAEAFSRAGYFTIDCEAPNPRLYSFEGAICQWDIPPTHKITRGGTGPTPQGTNSSAGAAAAARNNNHQQQHSELEMAGGAGGASSQGWYRTEQQQQQGQQQHGRKQPRPQSPLGRRSGSPQQRQQQQQGGFQRPQAAAAADGDSLTAALSSYGRQVCVSIYACVYVSVCLGMGMGLVGFMRSVGPSSVTQRFGCCCISGAATVPMLCLCKGWCLWSGCRQQVSMACCVGSCART